LARRRRPQARAKLAEIIGEQTDDLCDYDYDYDLDVNAVQSGLCTPSQVENHHRIPARRTSGAVDARKLPNETTRRKFQHHQHGEIDHRDA
jgi:hypothetical protein